LPAGTCAARVVAEAILTRLLLIVALCTPVLLSSCLAVAATGAVVGTAVGVTSAVVGGAVDVVTPDGDDDDEKPRG
jgi:hypothetical protein